MSFTSHSAVVTVPRLPSAEPVQQFRSAIGRDLFAFYADLMAPHIPRLRRGSDDMVTCSGCGESVPGGSVITVAGKPVCEACVEKGEQS